jgi:hypothetical protein
MTFLRRNWQFLLLGFVSWLDCLSPAGRLILPLTATMPAMKQIGKGLLLLVTRTPDSSSFGVRPLTFVAIYSAIGLRDEAINARIGQALARNPFPRIQILRRDAHDPSAACWLHCDAFCLSLGGSDPGLTPVRPQRGI